MECGLWLEIKAMLKHPPGEGGVQSHFQKVSQSLGPENWVKSLPSGGARAKSLGRIKEKEVLRHQPQGKILCPVHTPGGGGSRAKIKSVTLKKLISPPPPGVGCAPP